MTSYIFSIITISVVGGMVISFIDNENSALKKRVSFIVGIICAIILLSPIASTVSGISTVKNQITGIFDKVDKDSDASNRLIISAGTEKISEGIEDSVCEKYSIPREEVDITLTLNSSDIEAIKIEQITVVLTGKSTWEDEYEIKEYVEGITGCKTRVIKR